jgi:hypothetical protein
MRAGRAQRQLAALALLGCAALQAFERDPTQPPAGALMAPVTSGAVTANADAAQSPLPDLDAAAVVVRDGKRYVVSGTRLYAQGQAIGSFKIERISETEVWLRNGKQLRKIQRFSGIERQTATERQTP